MSQQEQKFLKLWESLYPFIALEQQYKFSKARKFKSDFAHIPSKTLIEIQGGTWSNSKMGHNSGSGIDRDYDKLAQAQMEGWAMFLLSSTMLNEKYIDKVAFTIRDRYLNQSGCSELSASMYGYTIKDNLECIRLRKSIKNYDVIWLKDKVVKRSKTETTLQKAQQSLAKKRNAFILPKNINYYCR